MNNSIKYIFTFSAGVTVGAFMSWQYLKKKYDELLVEQVEEAKEEFITDLEREAEAERKEYTKLCSEYNPDADEEPETDPVRAPYVITPEELGDVDEYDTTTLYYYADGVLVNLQDEIVEDVADTVGSDFAKHFGEYEDDSVCVRNEKHMCDYEILRDSRNYADIKREKACPNDTEE